MCELSDELWRADLAAQVHCLLLCPASAVSDKFIISDFFHNILALRAIL